MRSFGVKFVKVKISSAHEGPAHVILNDERLKASEIGNKARMFILPTFIQYFTEVPNRVKERMREREERERES